MLSNCHCWLKNTSSHCWNSILVTISLLVWILDTALYRAVISLDLTFSLFGCLPFHTIRNPPASDGHVPVRLQQPNSSYCRNFQVSICLAVEWTGMLRNMYTNWGLIFAIGDWQHPKRSPFFTFGGALSWGVTLMMMRRFGDIFHSRVNLYQENRGFFTVMVKFPWRLL